MAIDCKQLIETYGPGKEAAKGLKFDFSKMFIYGTPELWQVYTLTDIKKQAEVFIRVGEQSGPTETEGNNTAQRYHEVMFDLIDNYKVEHAFEEPWDMLDRAKLVNRFLKEAEKQ